MDWDIREAMEYYKRQGAPGDQNALVRLLTEIQEESGGSIPARAIQEVAQFYGIKASYPEAIIRRIPRLRIGDQHTLELCAGPNCGRHAALAALAEELSKNTGGRVTVKFVPCMRSCGQGPNIRWDGVIHHRADEALLKSLFRK